MTTSVPLELVWDGNVLRPTTPFWARKAQKELVAGEVYHMEDRPERSSNSHRSYFARINEIWSSLPDHLADRFTSPDALRRYALIATGWHDSQSMPCPSQEAAQKFAAFIRPIDAFALVTVTDCVVNVYRAKSQSMKAMGKVDFQASKTAVLDFLSDLIGTTAQELEKVG